MPTGVQFTMPVASLKDASGSFTSVRRVALKRSRQRSIKIAARCTSASKIRISSAPRYRRACRTAAPAPPAPSWKTTLQIGVRKPKLQATLKSGTVGIVANRFSFAEYHGVYGTYASDVRIDLGQERNDCLLVGMRHVHAYIALLAHLAEHGFELIKSPAQIEQLIGQIYPVSSRFANVHRRAP